MLNLEPHYCFISLQRRFISEVLRRTPESPSSLLDSVAPIDKLNDRLETLKKDINEVINLKKGG